MSYVKKILVAVVAILFAFFLYFSFPWESPGRKAGPVENEEVYRETNPEALTESEISISKKISEAEENDSLPESVYLKVPFLVQAPYANWDPLHEDACEEASLIMIKYFLDGDRKISLPEGDAEIINMVQYEESIGYGLSITMDQLAKIAKDHSKMKNPRVEKNITVEDMKRELAAGRPVIVPAAGKILPNPYFRDGGPLYHMLVITGYDKKGFITNDPGTKRGEGFRYSFSDLYNAIHDWDENDIFDGQKAYLVFD